MTAHHLPREDDDQPRQQPSPPNTVIKQLFKRLTTLPSQLRSAVELSSSLQAQNAIAALESEVSSLETLVRTSQVQEQGCSSSPVVFQASIDLTPLESDPPALSSTPAASSPSPSPPFLLHPPSYLQPDSQNLTEWKKSIEGQ